MQHLKATFKCRVILINTNTELQFLTQNPVSTLQLEGVFAAAEVVDEVAELVDVLQALGHDHLLVYQVRLRQVGAGLRRGSTNRSHYNNS